MHARTHMHIHTHVHKVMLVRMYLVIFFATMDGFHPLLMMRHYSVLQFVCV